MASGAVDWDVARRRAQTYAPPGPPVDRVEARSLVASLRASARVAPGFVGDVTGLADAAEVARGYDVLVVDRPRWAAANTALFESMLTGTPVPGGWGSARMAGEQLGAVLSLLSTRVLGQFDPYTQMPDGGRLLLVAPNILTFQRRLDVPPAEFHLWVCLHEQTHAVQFAAAPWLAEHLRTAMGRLSTSLAADSAAATRLRDLVAALPRVLSGETADATSGGVLLDAMLAPEERDDLERVLAVMALLEGHADVVMDEAGPTVVPSVETIRKRFEARRDGQGWFDVLLRRLLGLDAKLAQYREGAAFVRGVRDAVGHAGLNAVWTGPGQLPLPHEIADPTAWVRRVHGR